jgi:putative tryptophan/tyrosine transport system substrate-binding protein
MRRREFLSFLGASAAAWPMAARAQRTGSTPTIGVLMAGTENSAENAPRIAAFRQALTELGWKDGDNVHIQYRWSAGQSELISQYAKELVALTPAVILANSTPVISTLKSLTATVPVVFALAMDPVGLGQVQSLSHPGGNFTGFTFIDPELIGKWMQLLKDVVPELTQAALLYNPNVMRAYSNFAKEMEAIRRPGAVEFKTMPVGSTAEMETAMKALAKTGGGLMIGPDPFNQVRIKQIAEIALENRLPTISVYRPFVAAGGLMAYGPDTADVFRRAASYVDRVLKGENPADLPVQQPNKFEFVVNLKTAKALGLTVSPTLLATTDEVIE